MKNAPVKIYLDQKDYSRIGKGLFGTPDYDEDVRVYNFLLELVRSNTIRIYFSWCHIVEAMRYDEQKVDLLDPYCEAIDSLTQGHCIKWTGELEKKELELFLCHHFNFTADTADITEDNYAYGKFKDAVPLADDVDIDRTEIVEQIVQESIHKGLIAGRQKKKALKYLMKPKRFKKLVSEILAEAFQTMGLKFPGLSIGNMYTLLLGDLSARKKAINEWFDNIVTFKNLVHYSRHFLQLRDLGSFPDKHSKKLKGLIKGMQALHPIYNVFDMPQMDATRLCSHFIQIFVDAHDDDLASLSNKYGFSVAEAKKILLKSESRGLPSVNAMITFFGEYYKRHKGDYDRGRTPLRSDIMDLYHIRNLPYVDFYCTDRFFGEVIRGKSKEFGTQVLTNFRDLKSILLTEARLG